MSVRAGVVALHMSIIFTSLIKFAVYFSVPSTEYRFRISSNTAVRQGNFTDYDFFQTKSAGMQF